MDEADQAKIYETQHRQRALDAARQRDAQPPQQRDDLGRVICLDCATRIPTARLHAKPDAARCTECEAAHEQRHRAAR